MIDPKTLEEIEAALAGATPSGWVARSIDVWRANGDSRPVVVGFGPRDATLPEAQANAKLTALLRNAAPALIESAKKLAEVQRENERLRDALADIGNMLPEQFTASWAGQRAREALAPDQADGECITCAGTGRMPSRRYICSKCKGTGKAGS